MASTHSRVALFFFFLTAVALLFLFQNFQFIFQILGGANYLLNTKVKHVVYRMKAFLILQPFGGKHRAQGKTIAVMGGVL